MAPDDDYWRRRDNADDDRRWQNAQDDRRRRAEQQNEKSRELHEAIWNKEYDKARWIVGVPPAEPYDESLDIPQRTEPPTAEEQFREHVQALQFNLRWADRFLPRELLDNWALRVAGLALAQGEMGLAAVETIRDEYQQAADYYRPQPTEMSRSLGWIDYVPRIGDEIDWLIALYGHAIEYWRTHGGG